jgi:hypothetical protein
MIISVTIKVCYLFIEILLSQNPEKCIIFAQRKAAATNRLDIPSPHTIACIDQKPLDINIKFRLSNRIRPVFTFNKESSTMPVYLQGMKLFKPSDDPLPQYWLL